MNSFLNRILGVVIGAALFAGAEVSALAQQAQFHLPFEAKWGPIVLPPGDYRVSLPQQSAGKSTFYLRGPAGPGFIVPMTTDAYGARSMPAGDYLELVKVDGVYFVKKYEAGSRALTFFFKTPHPSLRVQIGSTELFRIPVSGE
jgi:hypothetical protein